MTAKYEAFARFFFELIRREAAARETRDLIGNRRSYNVRINTFEKLRRLASEVVADKGNAEGVTEYQRESVVFVLHVDPATFGNFLCHLNGRYLVMNQFYPQCVGEFCYHRDWLAVSEWAAEAFNSEETTETTEPAETTEPETTPEASETTETAETTAEATEPTASETTAETEAEAKTETEAAPIAETTAEVERSEATPETKEETTEPTEATEATKATEPAPAFYMRPSGLSVYVDFDPEPDEETTEPAEPSGPSEPSEVSSEATAETTAEPVPSTLSIFVRFASDYSAAVGWELTARRAGEHSTLNAEAFGELHRLARSIVQNREAFNGLTVRQQTIINAVDSMRSAEAFNALHTKTSGETLEQFAADIAPTAAQLDEWAGVDALTPREWEAAPEPAPEPIPETTAEGSDDWANYGEVELNGATVDYVARRLFDVLPPRPSVGVVVIPRRGDEPLEVPAEPLRPLDARARLEYIAEVAETTPEVVAKMVYMAPWIGHEETTPPAEVDDGAAMVEATDEGESSGGLTWSDILSVDWSFYD